MSTFETIYVIGHTIGSFLLLMIQFFVVKDYIMPFVKRVYQYIIDDYEEFKQWQATKRQKGEDKMSELLKMEHLVKYYGIKPV